MDVGLMVEPHYGGTYDDLVGIARWAESQGFVTLARSDHYWWNDTQAATDAFVTLGGLARETSSIRLTVLVSPITFRHPAVIAKCAVTIDEMSGGRLDLGVGTGWLVPEHEVFGLDFPDRAERFDRLTESLGYIRAVFTGSTFTGQYYRLTAPTWPRPTGTKLIVGGSGPTKTPTLAGRYADEFNLLADDADEIKHRLDVMRSSAERNDRDPDEITISVMGEAIVGAGRAEYNELVRETAARRGVEIKTIESRMAGVPHGTIEQAAETFASWESVGVTRYYFQWLERMDLPAIQSAWGPVSQAIATV